MAFEKYYTHGWKHIPAPVSDSEHCKGGGFDCNICLDFASEPVVTLCGHLYCWSCIYKWLFVQSASLSHDDPPQCPVCKADISHTKMVPLYGRGQSADEAEHEERAHIRRTIPPRPSGCHKTLTSTMPNNIQQLPYRNPYQNENFDPYEEESESSMLDSGGNSINGFHHPTVGMIGEMVYHRVFGNTQRLYTYPNSYHLMGNNTPRFRRQEIRADKSLNRISIFFFCCFLLCLIFF